MGPRRHDDRVGLLGAERALGRDLEKLVARQIGEIVEGLDPLLPERDQDRRREPRDRAQLVGNPEFAPPFVELAVALGEELAGALAELLGDLLVEALDPGELVAGHERDLLDRGEAFSDQEMGDHVVDVERFDEGLRARAELLAAAVRFLGLGQDIDVPAGELRGEPHVLPPPPDGEAELVVGHHDLDALGLLVEHHLGHLGGGERVDHEGRRVGRPLDDVDLLALELGDDGLDPAAAHADAGADGVDARIVRDHRNLGPAPGIAGDRLDLDDAVVDLGHLLGEQLGHELGVGPREEDLRPARLAAHVVDVGPHPVALMEGLARQQLVAAQKRLGPAEIDHHVAVLHPLDETVHDLACAVLVLLVLALALGLAHLLHDHLLGGLGGDAPELDRRQGLDQLVADRGVGLARPGVFDRDLGRRIFDLVDHVDHAHQAHRAGLAVDLGPDVVFLAVLALAGVLNRLLHSVEHRVALDPFLARDRVGHLQQFLAVEDRACLGLHGS